VTTPAPDYDADGLDGSWDGDCSDLPDLTGLGVSHMETAERDLGETPPAESSQRAMPKLGTGKRFAKLKSSLAAKGAHDPGALAAYIGRRKFGKAKFAKIAAKARGGSHRSEDVADAGSAASLAPYFRSFPLEDISIRSGDGGRTVEAYAAVFGVPAAVFNRAISDAAPQGGRKNWRMGVFYNHGMTLFGTPSERHAMPIGKTVDMKADSRGLWTLTRYHRSELADEVLENIREGSITGYSFSGNFRRSQPLIPRGGFRPNYRTGELPHVRRTESTLKEYGPTPVPIYQDASVVGMRAEQILGAMAADPETAQRLLKMFSGGALEDSLPDPGAPIPGLAAEDSHVTVRSGRSVKEEIAAARSVFLQRYRR